MRQIIGHGTWYDKMAQEIIIREKRLKRNFDILKTESGLGASGIPHIGSLADAARSYAISLALQHQDCQSELIAFSDDKDGLRKVPAGFSAKLKKYIGYPVTSIPDPFGNCHPSFGDHMTSLLLEALDSCGIEYTFMSASDVYKKGLLNEQIELLLSNGNRVGQIVKDEVGQDKFTKVLPYFPMCNNCGRIYTTNAYEFLSKEHTVLYSCEGMEIGNQWLEGCGYQGEVDYRAGEGKLSWKGEFAARWAALKISFEAYGKDISDSVRVNDRICREILNFEPPLHVQYEIFLDKGGKKISKSKGNVFTPQHWFKYGSPQSLLLLTLKRFTGTRTLSIQDIPQYMNELDELEDVYFGKKRIKDTKDRAKLIGLYLYCWGLKPPKQLRTHIPYRLLINLAQVAPEGSQEDFVKEKLTRYGYDLLSDDVDDRIKYAINWTNDLEEVEEKRIELSGNETNAVRDLASKLGHEEDADIIQEAIFEIARKNQVKTRRFFQILYQIIIGATKGPRLGPYLIDMNKNEAIAKLMKAIT